MEKSRYWCVRVCDSVQWFHKLPRSAEVWRVCGSRRVVDAMCSSQEYVVRYLNPVSQRNVCKLPVVSVSVWTCEPSILKDTTSYIKMKWQDEQTIEFFKSFQHKH